MTGLQRMREVVREAWRNLATGTTKPLIALLAFAIVVGAVGAAQARGYVGVAQAALAWQQQGSAVSIITLEGHIDGRQCDALAAAPGINAAGAVRQATSLRLAAMPSVPVNAFEVTPGLAALLGVSAAPEQGPEGVWIAEDLAGVIGGATTTLPLVSDGGEGRGRWSDDGAAPVAGVFPLPAGGQSSPVDYSILVPAAATEPFDSCWVMLWPESQETVSLLTLTTLPTGQGPQGPSPRIGQLNMTAGTHFDAAGRLAALPTVPLTVAAVAFAAVLGFGLTTSRRLELASALHAGVRKSSLLIQLAAETAGWLLAATAVVIPLAYVAAHRGNPDAPWVAFSPALRTTVLAVIATLLATLLAGALVREKHLFRHFKQR